MANDCLIGFVLQKTSFARMSQRTRQLQSDVRQFGEASSRQLDERLERLWRHKQREKEDRMKVIRKIHDKEQKSLEKKCNDLNSYIHRGTFKRPPSYQGELLIKSGIPCNVCNFLWSQKRLHNYSFHFPIIIFLNLLFHAQ